MTKVKVAIIGSGNVGMDLLIKIQKSDFLECGMFIGRDPESKGIQRAKKMGVETSSDSINAIINEPCCCDIVFDATTADAHSYNAPILKRLGKFTIDLTPSGIGEMCIPILNIKECLDLDNVNLITCGGQVATPIIKAITSVHPEIRYVEVISSISSKSAGKGTRENIDEYTQATKDAITKFTKVPKSKAMIILNPAEPPVIMHNTIYALIDNPNINKIKLEIDSMVKKIQEYIPGCKITLGPLFENGKLTTMVEVVGVGDYLPKYAGNLDIITSAAIKVAKEYTKKNWNKVI
jgi:acetaldehyde dehydrogenase (acetylating)